MIVDLSDGHFPDALATQLPLIHSRTEGPLEGVSIHTSPDRGQFYCRYADATEFAYDRQARHLWGRWPANLSFENALTYLLGPVAGLVLRARGEICLHASVIEVEGECMALTGPGGSGKSTMAGLLSLRGHRVLTDDIAVLGQIDGRTTVRGGYPQINVWPGAAETLQALGADELPALVPGHTTFTKRALSNPVMPLGGRLKAVYAGAPQLQSVPHVRSLQAAEALTTLLRNVYAPYALTRRQRARDFDLLSEFAMRGSVRELRGVADFSQIEALADVLVDDFRKLTAS